MADPEKLFKVDVVTPSDPEAKALLEKQGDVKWQIQRSFLKQML